MATSTRQRRIVAAIVLSTLGMSGILISQGGTRLIASSAMPLDASAFSPGALGDVRPAPPEEADATAILRRNIFDHETGPLSRTPPVVDTGDDPDEVVEEQTTWEIGDPLPPACDGSMRLVGAFVRMREPEDSFAAITNAAGEALLYQTGMEIDDRQVVAILHNRVILQPSGGNVCSLAMFSQDERVATAPQPRVVTPARPRSRRRATGTPEGLDPAALEAGIDQVSENEYTIDRGLVNNLLSNQAALMRTARVIPHEEGGRVVGVKLYGIRRSSLLGRLGIQNGDMLRTINGYDMSAPDSALEAYARLRNADRITINLNRRGSDQTIDYQIR